MWHIISCTIIISSSVVQVRVDQSEYTTEENQSPLTVCATLVEANIVRSLVVIVSTSDGTAQGRHNNNYNIAIFLQYME